MDPAVGLSRLRQEVDVWVERTLPQDYPPQPWPDKSSKKVIREAVSGYQVLAPHEYVIIDSPIVQRLRHVHQTALAYLVYPTANHTRFDHSLGVAYAAHQISQQQGLDPSLAAELRLAALLHDVGQCLFSHLSETLMEYKFRDVYHAAKRAPEFSGRDLRLSEILSYLIITSQRFQSLLRNITGHYNPGVQVDRVAQLVIGKTPDDLAYLADIITGPFDADKCDYLVRDCYFTGIRADIDVPRVIISAALLDRSRFQVQDYPRRNLVMLRAGAPNLEQIVFNKMLLHPAIYHHHKIRALECMVRAIFETIWEAPDQISDEELRFERLQDFLSVSEPAFFARLLQQSHVGHMVQRILDRDLLKRCLVLSDSYMQGVGKHSLMKINSEKHPNQVRLYRELIWDLLPLSKRTSFADLWVDLPEIPAIGKDADGCFIDEGTPQLQPLANYFPYPRWVESYLERKWKGHVFYVANEDHRRATNKAARSTFNKVGVTFQPMATKECKL